MSKTLGTGIDPRDLIERYGADATRLSLLYQCGSAQDIRFDAEVEDNRLQDSPIAEMCRNFCNKIWNAARFVDMHLADRDPDDVDLLTAPWEVTDLSDRWILSLYARTVQRVTESLETYRFDDASRALHDFVWNGYCDWYVEMAKVRLNGDDAAARRTAQNLLMFLLEGILRLLHPMAPFISEEIWQRLPHRGEALIVADWPTANPGAIDEAVEQEMRVVQDVVGAIRNIRGTMRIPPGRRVDLHLKVADPAVQEVVSAAAPYVRELARVADFEMGPNLLRPRASASAVLPDLEIYVPLSGLIDLDVERRRLDKEMSGLRKALTGIEKKLDNPGFLKNAPEEVVASERARREEYEATLQKLVESMAALS